MAFYGIDSVLVKTVPEFSDCSDAGCLICEQQQDTLVHILFRQLRPDDVVFLKKFTPQSGLTILAAGVVAPGSHIEEGRWNCIHVKWGWTGELRLPQPEDKDNSRGDSGYEEFDLELQRKLMDMLPASRHDSFPA